MVDAVVPTIGQYLASLDGMTFDTTDGAVVVDVVETTHGRRRHRDRWWRPPRCVFLKPGLLTRILRLAVRPEATFFFLVAGLAAASFEFYAAGAGISRLGRLSLPVSRRVRRRLSADELARARRRALGVVLVTIDFQDAATELARCCWHRSPCSSAVST